MSERQSIQDGAIVGLQAVMGGIEDRSNGGVTTVLPTVRVEHRQLEPEPDPNAQTVPLEGASRTTVHHLSPERRHALERAARERGCSVADLLSGRARNA